MSLDYEMATIVRVVDGDTIIVRREGMLDTRVRLIGIDAPESVCPDPARNSHEGELAAMFLKALLPEGRRVWLERDIREYDDHRRLLRYVWLTEPMEPVTTAQVARFLVNAIMVREGYAQSKHYRPDKHHQPLLDSLCEEAVRNHKGVSFLWARRRRRKRRVA